MTTLTADELYSLEQTGRHLLERGKYGDAHDLFAGITSLAPSSWYAYYALGVIAQKNQKDLERALSYYTHAEQLAKSAQAGPTLARAHVHILLEQHAEARAALARILQSSHHKDAVHDRARALMHTLNA